MGCPKSIQPLGRAGHDGLLPSRTEFAAHRKISNGGIAVRHNLGRLFNNGGNHVRHHRKTGPPNPLRQRVRRRMGQQQPSRIFYNTTFCRVYKDGSIWGESASFEDRDLPNLAKAAADAHSWIYQQKALAVTVTGNEPT
jgi:hypothetical protein